MLLYSNSRENTVTYQFTPKWSLTVITLFGLVLLLSLGSWQLRRADMKRTLLQNYSRNRSAPMMPLAQLTAGENNDYRAVTLHGQFDDAHSLLLDNQIFQHQVGYLVLTPFKNDATEQWILVNRGWIPQGSDRQFLPVIKKTTPGQIQIDGLLKRPSHLLLLKKEVWGHHYPLRIQAVDLTKLSQHLQQPFYDYTLLLSADDPNGFERSWAAPAPRVSVKRHVAYAVQWFLLAAILVILYVIASMTRDNI